MMICTMRRMALTSVVAAEALVAQAEAETATGVIMTPGSSSCLSSATDKARSVTHAMTTVEGTGVLDPADVSVVDANRDAVPAVELALAVEAGLGVW